MVASPAPEPTRVLALMPMLEGYEAVRASVADTVAAAGLELLWLEDILEDWEWLEWLYRSVRHCDLILANPSKHNAFVMYELGVARGNSRPTLLMLDQEDSQLSGSLDGSAYLPYSNDQLKDFSNRLHTDLTIIKAEKLQTDPAPDPRAFYGDAVDAMDRLNDDARTRLEPVDEDAFTARLTHSMAHGTFVASMAQTSLGQAGLLSALVRSSRMMETMAAIRAWTDRQGAQGHEIHGL